MCTLVNWNFDEKVCIVSLIIQYHFISKVCLRRFVVLNLLLEAYVFHSWKVKFTSGLKFKLVSLSKNMSLQNGALTGRLISALNFAGIHFCDINFKHSKNNCTLKWPPLSLMVCSCLLLYCKLILVQNLLEMNLQWSDARLGLCCAVFMVWLSHYLTGYQCRSHW